MRAQRLKTLAWKGTSLTLLILLGGMAMGAALAVYDLNRFSPIPSTIMLIFPFVVGMIIGVLTTSFAQALGVFFFTVLVYALADFLVLTFPEMIHAHLGREITMQVSVVKALTGGIIFVLPLTLIGIILGKLVSRGD
ncbi:MAG: hypothetical protein NUW06_06490 [Candidatus Acetothermia bacterium]|nr:hypothetical protein [Candidatus Acetothermia bacterium]MDH7505717.1 hypothetical protein [Candidatus Acetothermia bacterium]